MLHTSDFEEYNPVATDIDEHRAEARPQGCEGEAGSQSVFIVYKAQVIMT